MQSQGEPHDPTVNFDVVSNFTVSR